MITTDSPLGQIAARGIKGMKRLVNTFDPGVVKILFWQDDRWYKIEQEQLNKVINTVSTSY